MYEVNALFYLKGKMFSFFPKKLSKLKIGIQQEYCYYPIPRFGRPAAAAVSDGQSLDMQQPSNKQPEAVPGETV